MLKTNLNFHENTKMNNAFQVDCLLWLSAPGPLDPTEYINLKHQVVNIQHVLPYNIVINACLVEPVKLIHTWGSPVCTEDFFTLFKMLLYNIKIYYEFGGLITFLLPTHATLQVTYYFTRVKTLQIESDVIV